MVNLDGNPYEKEGEVVHWIVANIPDGKGVEDGEEVQHFPVAGIEAGIDPSFTVGTVPSTFTIQWLWLPSSSAAVIPARKPAQIAAFALQVGFFHVQLYLRGTKLLSFSVIRLLVEFYRCQSCTSSTKTWSHRRPCHSFKPPTIFLWRVSCTQWVRGRFPFFLKILSLSANYSLSFADLKSPIYEYQYNEALKPEQKEFPKKPQPFDL